MNQKGAGVILIVILVAAAVLGGYFIYQTVQKPSIPSPQTQTASASPNVFQNKLRLQDDKVIWRLDEQETILFTNIENISEVRLGPDQRTIHFRMIRSNFNQAFCADLETRIEPAPADYSSPPPAQPPWDYKRVRHAYTINHCNNEHAGGYLKSSPYFVYLIIKNPNDGLIVYEDLNTKKIGSVKVDPQFLKGVTDGNQIAESSYSVDPILGKDGYSYIYPHQDAKVLGNKLVLAFGRLVLGIDINNNSWMGAKEFLYKDKDNIVIATSFYLLNERPLPFVVMEAVWEGPPKLVTIFDLSGNELKSVEISHLDKRPWFDYGILPLVWEEKSILFNFASVDVITDQLPSQYRQGFEYDENQMKTINQQAENILKQGSRYQDIKCDLYVGLGTPICEGLKGVTKYRYTSNQGLVKI